MKAFFIFLFFLSTTASAQLAEREPIFLSITKSGRDIVFMSPSEAMGHCLAIGARLPTARELAILAKRQGARGIVSSCESDNRCTLIQAVNADGRSLDRFYFSYAGYQKPTAVDNDSSELTVMWSSSINAILTFDGSYALYNPLIHRDRGPVKFYTFYGKTGALNYFGYTSIRAAARCVKDQ